MHHDQNMILATLATAAFAGVILMVIAQRLRIPAIVPLLFGGVLLGPEFLGLVDPDSLGDTLRAIIMIAVAIILFEGGLTLDPAGFKRSPVVIRRILTYGVLITWFGAAFGLWMFVGLEFKHALVGGSLVIVTGPTVVAPILRRLRLEQRLDSILRWEGVLIDPVGVFIAVVTFGYVYSTDQHAVEPLLGFAERLVVGFVLGVSAGFIFDALNRRRWIPEDFLNLVGLTSGIFVFWICESLATESGLLAVVMMGFVLAVRKSPRLKELTHFKQELTELSIAVLFVLLAARLKLESFSALGIGGVLAIGTLVVARLLNVIVSTWGLDFSWKERLFLGWVAPRGIVAASMASLFAMEMGPEGQVLEAYTYAVIGFTVVLQGLSAGFVARLLDLRRPAPRGWLIVGAHAFSRKLSRFITEKSGAPVVLVDTNIRSVGRTADEGLSALHADAMEGEFREGPEAEKAAHILALTDNIPLNLLICQRWRESNRVIKTYYWGGPVPQRDDVHSSILPVFDGLPAPSVLSHELEMGESRLVHVAPGSEAPTDETFVLTMGAGGQGFQSEHFVPDEQTGLYLRRAKVVLRRIFSSQLVRCQPTGEREPVLRRLLQAFTDLYPELPMEVILRELLEREESFPTALGEGLALPHAYSPLLKTPLCAVALVEEGISDWPAPDGVPIRLVFLLISPKGDAERHLLVLSEIVKLLLEPGMTDKLLAAHAEGELAKALMEAG